MGKAIEQKKCIRVGDVRKDLREIAEFYFDLDNKTNFTTFSVLCSPLIAGNESIGVIHCLNKKTENKLTFFSINRKTLSMLKFENGAEGNPYQCRRVNPKSFRSEMRKAFRPLRRELKRRVSGNQI